MRGATTTAAETPARTAGRGARTVTTMAVAGALALAALPGVGVGEAAGQEEVRLAGDRVAIYNVAGEVNVVRGDGSDVVVRIRRGGADAARLEVEAGEIRGRNTLRVRYPDDRIVYSTRGWNGSSTFRVRADGTFGDGGERVQVSSSGRGLEAHADLTVEVPAGRDVAVFIAVGRIDARDVEGDLWLDTHSGGITARGIRGDLGADTGSGSVEVADVTGEVEVDTGSGSVRVDRIEGPSVRIDTGSGGVRGGSITAAEVEVDTGSGGVELMGLRVPSLTVDTGSGSVELELLVDVDYLEVDTGSGGVTLTLPADAGAAVELETGSGGIDLDLPVRLDRMERDYVRGSLGDGRGDIRIDTGSGGIRIRGS